MVNFLLATRLRYLAIGFSFGFAWLASGASASAQSAPQRLANPYYSPGPAAANAAATLMEPHVVYPAVTTNPVNAKGLPRDRAAALRVAVSVATLDDAYRAGVAATEVATPNHVAISAPGSSQGYAVSNEPRRFAPDAGASQIPQSMNGSLTQASSKHIAPTNAGARRDTAVQPVVWLSDAPSSRPTELASKPSMTQPQPIDVGNPLRREAGNTAGNPLR